MEQALSLSANAHLIIEAAAPHRVIHSNAAFHMLPFPKQQKTRINDDDDDDNSWTSLEAEIHDTFGKHHRTVTIFPLCSSAAAAVAEESPRHYLVEVSDNSTGAADGAKLSEVDCLSFLITGQPAQAVA